MISQEKILEQVETPPQQKENPAETILQMLRTGGWVNINNQEHDLAPLLPILSEALGVNTGIHNLCAALPWQENINGKEREKTLGFTDLLNAVAELGFVAYAVKMPLANLDIRLCPCLFAYENSGVEEVIAILKFDKDSELFDIFDTQRQEYQKISTKDVPAGTAWIFMPEEHVQNSLSKNIREASGHSWFRALIERFANGLWQVIAIGAILTIISLAAPVFVMLVYDRVIIAHAPEVLMPLLIGAVLALGTEAALRLVRAQVLSWYGARLDFIVGSQIFERLMIMPVLFTERASVAIQIAQIRAFDTVRAFFTGGAFLALAELPFTLILVAAIVIIAGPIAFVPVVAGVFYALLVFTMRPSIRTAMHLNSKADSAKQEMTIETFEKMEGLRSGGLTSIWFKDFRDLSGKSSLASFRASFLTAVLESLSYGIYMLAGLFVVVWGVIYIWAGSMSGGALIAVMILTWRVVAPMQILSNALPRFEQLNNAITQINHLMAIETENSNTRITARLDDPKGEISFNKVAIRYTKDSDPVFTGLDFTAKSGDMIAITGGNGSGKSAMLKLINGMYPTQAGAIHIDGIDIRQLELQDLRRHIAYVPQNPSIFLGSVADNLRFANPMATDEMIHGVLEQVDLLNYVEKLPLGINTIIGMRGPSQLPSGLSYNLNLARAYIKDTQIMLIDEMPYAFLNSPSGEYFKKTLESWKSNKTVIIITHREDYLALADKAILLRSGQPALIDTPKKIIQSIYKSQEYAHA